jgi:hypothetical protein
MSDPESAPPQPEPGDFVVLYQAGGPVDTPRVALIRIADGASPTLIRASFAMPDDAGPRFEDAARLMAAAAGSRGLRCMDGRYELIDATIDRHDA